MSTSQIETTVVQTQEIC